MNLQADYYYKTANGLKAYIAKKEMQQIGENRFKFFYYGTIAYPHPGFPSVTLKKKAEWDADGKNKLSCYDLISEWRS